jgi:hypothetical protein
MKFLKTATFSWTTAGGSFLGPINLTKSCTKSLLVTSKWNLLPQFLTQASNTYIEKNANQDMTY